MNLRDAMKKARNSNIKKMEEVKRRLRARNMELSALKGTGY